MSFCPSLDRIMHTLYLAQYWLDPFYIDTSYQSTSDDVLYVKFYVVLKIGFFWQFVLICNFRFVLCPYNVYVKIDSCSEFLLQPILIFHDTSRWFTYHKFGLWPKLYFSVFGYFVICAFQLSVCGSIKDKVDSSSEFQIAVTLNFLKFDMLTNFYHRQNWLDFGRLLIFPIVASFWLSETGQICDIWSGHCIENTREEWPEIWHFAVFWLPSELIRFWSLSADFSHSSTIFTVQIWSFVGFL